MSVGLVVGGAVCMRVCMCECKLDQLTMRCKGAPQFGGCWHCGGAHYAKDCTAKKGYTGWQGKGWEDGKIRSLCSTRSQKAEGEKDKNELPEDIISKKRTDVNDEMFW